MEAKYNALTEAKIINQVFAKHKAGFRVDPTLKWRETPAFALFKLDKAAREDIGKIYQLRDNVEYALHAHRYQHGLVDDGGRTLVRVNLQPFVLEVNLPNPGSLPYNYKQLPAQLYTGYCGLHYGIKHDTPMLWDPTDSAQPHVLVAGTTGSGKTTLVQSIVLSMCAKTPVIDLKFMFIDYKNSPSLRWLAKLPHVLSMVTEPDEALESLEQFYVEILRRKRHQPQDAARMVLVVDELASFTDNHDRAYKNRTTHLLHEIARLGREYKMHLVACTQKPTANIIGEQLKANLPVRLVGMVTSPEESKCATGIAQAGAHLLPGKGAFIHVNAGQVRRFQAPWIDDLAHEVREVRKNQRGREPVDALPSTTTITTKPATVVAQPVAHRSPVEQDADVISQAWKENRSQAEMIRILTGQPDANTGGANRRRLLAALAVLERTTTTTTTTGGGASTRVQSFTFRGSSSDLRAM